VGTLSQEDSAPQRSSSYAQNLSETLPTRWSFASARVGMPLRMSRGNRLQDLTDAGAVSTIAAVKKRAREGECS
jgi:hypothetical protein